MLLLYVLISRPQQPETKLLQRRGFRWSNVPYAVCALVILVFAGYVNSYDAYIGYRGNLTAYTEERAKYQDKYADFLSEVALLDAAQPARILYCGTTEGPDYTFLHYFASPFSIVMQAAGLEESALADSIISSHSQYVYISDSVDAVGLSALVQGGAVEYNTLYTVIQRDGTVLLEH